jgi:hypothetical protein
MDQMHFKPFMTAINIANSNTSSLVKKVILKMFASLSCVIIFCLDVCEGRSIFLVRVLRKMRDPGRRPQTHHQYSYISFLISVGCILTRLLYHYGPT